MEDYKFTKKEQDIEYSKVVKAGKRVYFLDVKRSRNNDLFMTITESKKKFSGDDNDPQITFEKHKIFLYKEDFEKFAEAFDEVVDYINEENEKNGAIDIRDMKNSNYERRESEAAPEEKSDSNYDVDMDFEI